MTDKRRDFRPITIGAAINNFLRHLGAKAPDAELSKKWGEIVGQDSELVKISKGVRGRTAYVRAKNPAAKLALSYQTPEIVKKINAYFGYEAAAKVVIR